MKAKILLAQTLPFSNSQYKFSFDDQKGLEFKMSNYDSYTFLILRNYPQNIVENLVFSKNVLGSYDVYIATYNMTNEALSNVTKDQLKNKVRYTNLSTGKVTALCGFPVVMCSYTTPETPNNHVANLRDGCFGHPDTLYVDLIIQDCPEGNDGGGGDGGDGGNGNGNNGHGNGGLGGVIVDDDIIITVPMTPPSLTPCQKVKRAFVTTPGLQNELSQMAGKTGESAEWGRYKKTDALAIQTPPSNSSGAVSFPPPNSGKYTMMAHTHNSPASATYSTFSWEDLFIMAKLVREGKIDTENFVAFLATADGTYYAFTIEDPAAFAQFFAIAGEEGFDLAVGQRRLNAMNKYFDPQRQGNPIIKENNTDNLKDEKAFLDFMQNNNLGASLIESNSSFTTFDKVTHNTTTDNVDKQPCN